MTKKKLGSVLISIMLVLANVFGLLPAVPIIAAEPTTTPGNVKLEAKETGNILVKFKLGEYTDFKFGYIAYTKDGKNWPAYCIQPDKPGVDSTGSYEVDASTLLENPQVYGAVVNGHPFKTPSELGVNNTYEAYYITKLAIWSIVHDNYSSPDDFTANGSDNEHIVTAYRNLLDKAKKTNDIKDVTLNVNKINYEASKGFQLTTFEVEPHVGMYNVRIEGSSPTGTIITDINGNPNTLFKGSESFMVKVPTSSIMNAGSFNIIVSAASGSGKAMVYEGTPTSNPDSKQFYAVVYEGELSGYGTVSYEAADVPIEEDIPEDVLIKKLAAGTLIPLAGARIKITKATGGIVGHYYTNSKGEINVKLDPGVYFFDEDIPPKGYLLDENSHKEVVVEAGKPTVITFKNEKTPSLEVYKYGPDSEPVPNTVFQVSLDGGSDTYTIRTDSSGKAVLGTAIDLVPGTYTVKEISVPAPYYIDSANCFKIVKLMPGKGESISFVNNKKPGILIRKYIEGTDTLLDNAEFSVAKKGGSILWEGIVQNGTHFLEDLSPGWYTITELAPPDGFITGETKSKDVYLEPNATVEVKFDNRRRPELEIIKVDDKGNPLPNALFSIRKADGSTVVQKMTDSKGRIYIPYLSTEIKLDEGVYEVKELQAPDGYIMDEKCIKTIQLEWGQTKTLTFVNKKKPTLEILKIDAQSKLPISDTKYRITYLEDGSYNEYLTDKNGKINVVLNEGVYKVEETVANDAYILQKQHKEIKLVAGDEEKLVFENVKKPELEILKIDSVTKQPIPNTKYKLTKVEDETVSEYLTDKDGKITVSLDAESIYKIEETVANSQYILHSNAKEIKLSGGDKKQLIFENTKRPTVVITKINALTQKGIPNTSFLIQYEDRVGGIVTLGTYKTDDNGQIIIPFVNSGWYIFTETVPAQGMSLPSNPVTRKYLAPGDYTYALQLNSNLKPGEQIVNGNILSGNESVNNDYIITSGLDYNLGQEIVNWPLNSIVIVKENAVTGELLAGASFEVRRVTDDISGSSGTVIGRFTTNHSGIIVITGLSPGGYIVEEVQSPDNFTLSENNQQQAWLKADGTSIVEKTFSNYPYGSLLITKVDALTNKPLKNVRFRVVDSSGAVAGNANGEYVTDENGEILISSLQPNSYVVTEIESAPNYSIDTTPQTIVVNADGKTYKVSFKNNPYGTFVIKKLDSKTKLPIKGVTFKLTDSKGTVIGNNNGMYTTDEQGTIIVSNLPKTTIIYKEISAPENYIVKNVTGSIDIEYGKTHSVEIFNDQKSGLQVIKIDADTKKPLKSAFFNVYKMNGELMGTYETNADGIFILDNLDPGWIKIVEHKPPAGGYLRDDTPIDVEIKYGEFHKIVVENKRIGSLIIKKIDEISKAPLSGAVFVVEQQNGALVGEYETDQDGTIVVPAEPSWLVIREKKAPSGYVLDSVPKTVEIKAGVPTTATFANRKTPSLVVKKEDFYTHKPISDTLFIVETVSGQKVGEFKTDSAGKFTVALKPDSYIVYEKTANSGYILDTSPQTVEILAGESKELTFLNKSKPSLQVKKINSETREPIADVRFSLTKQNGEKIGEFKTDRLGMIFVSNLEVGNYYLTEISNEGYVVDKEPKLVEIKTKDSPTIIEVENQPISSLLIVKRDMATKKPLEKVKFAITKENGEKVGEHIYTTDSRGRIYVELPAGKYHVVEVEAKAGYQLDTDVFKVDVRAGKQELLEVYNKPLSGLRLLKIDALTGDPIYNVEFMVFDSNGKVVGNFYTDNRGLIDFSAILVEGRYTIRETREAEGYYADDKPRTVEFVAGKMTEIVWKNTPKAAQIQITKLSEDDNEVNGLPARTPLKDAIFEVYAYKSGKLVDRFVTGTNGIGVSKPLPLGRYIIKEVQAPMYYQLNNKELDVTLEFATQIVKLEYTNKSANTGVSIRKTGNTEAMPNDTIRYDIKSVRNDSSVALTDFYWREVLPVDAVRLTKIVTGTYNQSLKYKILATTNKGNTIIIADNLSTTKNNVIDCSNASLGLGSSEFVTSFTLMFGNVKSGFTCVEQPQIFVKVLSNLPNGYQFSNKVDVGGKHGGEWIIGNSTWLTTIYRYTNDKLPKTGY